MNFLGNIGGVADPQMNNAFAMQGGELPQLPDGSAQIQAALQRNQQLGQQQAQQKRDKGPGAFRNILGTIGDALLINSGHAPVYAQHKQQQQAQERKARLGQMLGNYLGNSDAALAELFAEDPDTALAIYKMKNTLADKPAGVDEYEYARSQGFGGTYMDFLQQKGGPMIASNGDGTFTVIPRAMQQPSQQQPQQGGGMPTVSSPDEARQLPPGTQFRMPDGRIGTVPGGPTQPASGGFPAQ